MTDRLSRRDFVAATGALAGATILAAGAPAGAPAATAPSQRFILGLNTGTILGHHLSAPEQVDVAAKAGYRAIEPWTGDLKKYVDGGGSLKDLRKRIDDAGLLVSSAIDFSPWAVAERAARARGIEQMKHAMGMLAELGGRHIAAAPAGIHRTPGIDLLDVARRYREILEIGASIGVIPVGDLGRSGNARQGRRAASWPCRPPRKLPAARRHHMYRRKPSRPAAPQRRRWSISTSTTTPPTRRSTRSTTRTAFIQATESVRWPTCFEPSRDGLPRRHSPGTLQQDLLGAVRRADQRPAGTRKTAVLEKAFG